MGKLRKTVARLILVFMTLIGGSLICETPVFGITNATISIDLGTLTTLDLVPGHFGSTSQSVGVTTDNYTGYTVSLTNSVNDTALVNTSDNTLTIPTITLPNGSTSITASQFDSGYGISADGTNYVPAPTSTNNIVLGTTNASGTGSHTATFGAKPATDTAVGSYVHTFVITAVVNNPQYSITYDKNTTDTVNNMPSNVSTTTSDTGTADLSATEPTRTGYVFLGWDEDDTVTSDPTYPAGGGGSITLEPTQANAIELYAIWEERSSGSGTAEDPYIDSGEYDPTGLTEGTTLYEEVAGAPQVTVEDGVVTEFAFTDTGDEGVSADEAAVDTGFIPFDGNTEFELYIKANFPAASNNSSPPGMLVDVRDRLNNSGNFLQITYPVGGTSPKINVNSNSNSYLFTLYDGGSLGSSIIEAKITYQNGRLIAQNYRNGTALSPDVYNRTTSLSIANQSIYLGYTINTSGAVIRQAQDTTIYAFYVKKL